MHKWLTISYHSDTRIVDTGPITKDATDVAFILDGDVL